MDSIIEQIKTLAEATDVAGRKRIQDALQNVCLDFEEPLDIVQRMLRGVSRPSHPVFLSPAILSISNVFIDLILPGTKARNND